MVTDRLPRSACKSLVAAIAFLTLVFAVMTVLSVGLYPPFRGQGHVWTDILGAGPDVVRFIAAATLSLLILALYSQLTKGSYTLVATPSVVPLFASGTMLTGFALALRAANDGPISEWSATLLLGLWTVLFGLGTLFVRPLIPVVHFRRCWIAALFIGFAAALSPRLESLTGPALVTLLMEPTLKLVTGWLKLVGHEEAVIERVSDDFITIYVEDFKVGIGPSCSGYEGAGLALLLVGAYVFFNRGRLIFPRVFVVFPIIIASLFFLNSIRIFILILIGAHISPAIAVEGFHIYAGWIYLITVTLTVCVWLETSPAMSRTPVLNFSLDQVLAINRSDDADMIIPLLVFLFLSIITGAITAHVNWLFPIAASITGLVAWPYVQRLTRGPSGFEGLAIALGIAVAGLWFLLVPHDPASSLDFETDLLSAPAWAIVIWILFRLIGASILVPFVEELGFRGAIQGQLGHALKGFFGRRATHLSVGISSLIFGLMHSHIVAGALAGLAYGWLRERSGCLTAPILAHAVTNLIISLYVLAVGAWSFWCKRELETTAHLA